MNLFTRISGGLFLTIIIIAGLFTVQKYQKKDRTNIRCALIAPAEHPAMNEIMNGFEKTFSQKIPTASFERYNGQGNKTLLHSQIEKIIHDDVDFILTIGASTSQLTHEMLTKRNIESKIQIFTAVDDPVQKGLVKSLEKPTGFTTGVISDPQINQQIEKLLLVKPAAQKIAFIYDPAHPSNTEDKKTLEKICIQKGLILSTLAVANTNEIGQKLPSILNTVDTILIFKDHLVVTAVDLLIKLCNTNNITLYCSDLNSGQKGAALAFGIVENDYGKYAGELAYQITTKEKDTPLPSVFRINKNQFQLNSKTMPKQGLVLSTETLNSLAKKGVTII